MRQRDRSQARARVDREGIPPRKKYGQHFVTDRNILRKLVRGAQLHVGDTVLEIGPGRGDLTHVLAETGAKVVAVEIDRDLVGLLRREFAAELNVHILEGNILDRPPQAWLAEAGLAPPYCVVANLPYYITSAILRYLLEVPFPPVQIVIMVQREVAQQIVAQPPYGNLLGVSVQFYGTPRILDRVPAGAFFPRPKVDSAIVQIQVHPPPAKIAPERFFELVRAGFGTRRKQLRNALANGLGISATEGEALLRRAGLDPARRAESLTLDDWERLYTFWDKSKSNSQGRQQGSERQARVAR